MITLGDIRSAASQIIAGGVCSDDARVATKINEATQRLFYLVRGQENQQEEVTLPVCGCYFSLDHRYERIIGKRVQIAGRPVPLYGLGYETLERGPGEIDCDSCNPMVIAEGKRSAMHPIDNKRVLVLPDSQQDESGAVNLQGTDSANREVVRGKRGEDVLISNSAPRFSYTEFRGELTAVTKPITKGWVYGYAFDPETNWKQLIFAMHPLQTYSQYARYKIVGAATCDSVVAAVLKKWYPVFTDTDVLPIQSMPAILDQLRAMEARVAKDPTAEAINSNSARAQLEARTEYGDVGQEGFDVRISNGAMRPYGDVY